MKKTLVLAVFVLFLSQAYMNPACAQARSHGEGPPVEVATGTVETAPAPGDINFIMENMDKAEEEETGKEEGKGALLYQSDAMPEAVHKVLKSYMAKLLDPIPERYEGLFTEPAKLESFEKRLIEELSSGEEEEEGKGFDSLTLEEKIAIIGGTADRLLPEMYPHDIFFAHFVDMMVKWMFPDKEMEVLMGYIPPELYDILEKKLKEEVAKESKNYGEVSLMGFFQMMEEAGMDMLQKKELEKALDSEKIIEISLQWLYNYRFRDVPAEIKKRADWEAIMDEHKRLMNLTLPDHYEEGAIAIKFIDILVHLENLLSDRLLHTFVRHTYKGK